SPAAPWCSRPPSRSPRGTPQACNKQASLTIQPAAAPLGAKASGLRPSLAQSFPQSKNHPGEATTTILRIAALVFTAAFAASAAHAEIKTQWIEYSHGDAKL